MIQNFDSYGLYEPPSFILCNPDKSELYSLGLIRERKYMPRYNGLGKISFIADAYVDSVAVEYYDYLEYRRLIYLENLGYFMISSISTDGDGINKTKTIEAESLEVELCTKKITSFVGTYKFWDILNPTDTLMGKLLDYLPGWSMGDYTFELTTKYRTFDVSDSTIYAFLMTNVEDAYQCIFDFDTINKTISAYTIADATTATDIYLSYDNLVKSIEIDTKTDELITALSVYGGGGLSINVVNPLGTPTIYDFSNFLSEEWMSGSLVDSVTAWNLKLTDKQTEYSGSTTSLLNQYIVLGEEEAVLSEYQTELSVLEVTKSAKIAAGQSLTAINVSIRAKQAQIVAQQAIVSGTEDEIDSITVNLNNVSDYLSFTNTNNFSEEQLTELSPFVIGSTYNNENIIQTDSMSASMIQTQAQYLFDQAEEVLAKIAQPRYEFKLESGNFIFIEDFQPFISEIVLGAVITIEVNEDSTTSTPVLLGLDLNYDNPEEFSLIFGNRLRLDNSAYALADLLNESFTSSINTRFNSEEWGNWTEHKDDVTTFITSSLDTATNNLISGSAKSILIDQSGIRIRESIGTNLFSPNQMWMNNGVLAFSDDSFETAKLALGQIVVNGLTLYGLVADAVVGHLIAGNELIISNSNPLTGETTFTVTGSMVTIVNGYFSTTNDNSTISIDPANGIRIDKILASGATQNQMYIDTSGNLVFRGDISGASGTFTGAINATSGYIDGWEIRDSGLWDTNGNYIRSDGKIRLGKLQIDGDRADFYGNFYASNLIDTLTWQQIGSVNANSIALGTLSAINIHGGRISWGGSYADPSAVMTSSGTGAATLLAETIRLGSIDDEIIAAELILNSGVNTDALLISPTNIIIGDTYYDAPTNIDLRGNIIIRGKQGVSGIFPIGDNRIEITEGIITETTVDGEIGLLGSTWVLSNPTFSQVSGITIDNPTASAGFGLVYKISGSNYLTLADKTTIAGASGFVMSVSDNKWLVQGMARNGSWSFTPGKLIYLSTNGQMTTTVPTGSNVVAQILGVAIEYTKIFFNPCLVQVEMN